MVMCLSCGEFVQAIPDGETVQPTSEECPECGETEFKDNDTGTTFDTREN